MKDIFSDIWILHAIQLFVSGSAHKHLILSKLSAELKRRIDPKRRIIEAKLTEWTAGMDKIAKSVENWDKQTSEGVRLIEETQSTQVPWLSSPTFWKMLYKSMQATQQPRFVNL